MQQTHNDHNSPPMIYYSNDSAKPFLGFPNCWATSGRWSWSYYQWPLAAVTTCRSLYTWTCRAICDGDCVSFAIEIRYAKPLLSPGMGGSRVRSKCGSRSRYMLSSKDKAVDVADTEPVWNASHAWRDLHVYVYIYMYIYIYIYKYKIYKIYTYI